MHKSVTGKHIGMESSNRLVLKFQVLISGFFAVWLSGSLGCFLKAQLRMNLTVILHLLASFRAAERLCPVHSQLMFSSHLEVISRYLIVR